MAGTFIAQGNTLTLTAPTGGVVSGAPIFIANVFAIPRGTVAQTLPFDAHVTGVHSLTKVGSQAWSEADRVYWDIANTRCSSDCSVGPLIGVAAEAVGSGAGSTTGKVRLNGPGIASGIFHCRQRFTVAQVNAGATLVPAIPGCKLRLIDGFTIAIGGAASQPFSILATLSTSRKLMAQAAAQSTQSTVLRAGATGSTVLADGASFTANDVNTAITIAKDSTDVATATSIDVSITYAIEPA